MFSTRNQAAETSRAARKIQRYQLRPTRMQQSDQALPQTVCLKMLLFAGNARHRHSPQLMTFVPSLSNTAEGTNVAASGRQSSRLALYGKRRTCRYVRQKQYMPLCAARQIPYRSLRTANAVQGARTAKPAQAVTWATFDRKRPTVTYSWSPVITWVPEAGAGPLN